MEGEQGLEDNLLKRIMRRQCPSWRGVTSAVDAHNRIWFPELWCEGLTHVVHRAVLGPGSSDEGV